MHVCRSYVCRLVWRSVVSEFSRVVQRLQVRAVLCVELLIKISFQNSLWWCVHQLCSPVIFSTGLYFFLISPSIVLQCGTSSSVAFLRGPIAGALLLHHEKTSYLLLLQSCSSLVWGPFVLMCQHVRWKPVSCHCVFTWLPPRQIPPFQLIMKVVLVWKRTHGLCFACYSGPLLLLTILRHGATLMHARYTVNYATTATEEAE